MNDRYAGVGSTAPKVDPRRTIAADYPSGQLVQDRIVPPPAVPTRGFIGDLVDGNDAILLRLNVLNERATIIAERLFEPIPLAKAEGNQVMVPCGLSWLSQQQMYIHAQLQRLTDTLDRLDRL